MRRLALVLVPLLGVVAGGAGMGAASGSRAASGPRTSPAGLVSAARVPTLAVAEREARDAGPASASTPLALTLVLRTRDQAGLDQLLAAGKTVTPGQWAATFGPDPAGVAQVEEVLEAEGLTATWSPIGALLGATGPASAVERVFGVSVHDFVLDGRQRFYGPTSPLAPPPALAAQVVAVTGATNYRQAHLAAIRGSNGLSPTEASDFYDITPLHQGGLDGSGMTVMFPEWAMPSNDVLSAYASKFGLPPFDVTVNQVFGSPQSSTSSSAGEAALDLEIVHGLAPAAKEIVYEIGDDNQFAQALQMMISQNPHAVLSSSIGNFGCEAEPDAKANATAIDAVLQQAARQGTTVFWATGDTGAFGCLPDGNASTQNDVSVLADGTDSPNATTVGGTAVFEAGNGAYFREAAWGEPLDQSGGGGGFSTFFSQPAYQVAPGAAAGSLSGRGVPDVSCDADPVVSGWDVFNPGSKGPDEAPAGGTSAAAPCWAAITALIDQDLANLSLPAVGFANPALYYFSTNPTGLPAPPFHDVTEGSNLHYNAVAGWNPATGLGSPDAAHLADDFEWYQKTPR